MITVETAAELRDLLGRYLKAQLASNAATEARAALLPGSSRAKVTTANARWANAAEHRDRCQEQVDRAIFRLIADGQGKALATATRTLSEITLADLARGPELLAKITSARNLLRSVLGQIFRDG